MNLLLCPPLICPPRSRTQCRSTNLTWTSGIQPPPSQTTALPPTAPASRPAMTAATCLCPPAPSCRTPPRSTPSPITSSHCSHRLSTHTDLTPHLTSHNISSPQKVARQQSMQYYRMIISGVLSYKPTMTMLCYIIYIVCTLSCQMLKIYQRSQTKTGIFHIFVVTSWVKYVGFSFQHSK